MRFGIRAKSIKNSARVNAELSPAELKALLKKAQAANTAHQNYIAALEAEIAQWRSGSQVDPADWASPDKSGPPSAKKKDTSTSSSSTPARSMTPVNPVIENLRSEVIDSRPQTPTVVGADEREEFLKRENELSDQIADKDNSLKASEKLLKELREEFGFLKEQETSVSRVRVERPASCLQVSTVLV
jgi:kinesin family protein 5